MFTTQLDLNTDESEESFENDLDEKYSSLQNNHRRLLGVATILTEALENTVKGCRFDMENTLNRCMEIYPELFTIQHRKKYSKLSHLQKIYTTPASDFTDTDVIKSSDDLLKNVQHLSYEVPHLQHSRNVLPIKTTNLNENLNEVIVKDLDNSISDATPYSKLYNNSYADYKRDSISSQNETDHLQNVQMPKNKSYADYHPNQEQNQPDENKYVVKLPESDNEQFKYETNRRRFSSDSIVHIQNNDIYVENLQPNNKSYEIIVHNTLSSGVDRVNDDDLLIKINPETKENKNFMESFHVATSETQMNQNFLNTPRKTIISSPLETCIIITNHVNTGMQKNIDSNQNERIKHISYNSSYAMSKKRTQATENDEEIFEQSYFIEDKLQKLSTGLKAQVNVMQMPDSQREKNILSYSEDNAALKDHINKQEIIGLSYKTDREKKYYEKLKNDMMTGSVNECAAILQSLRLKLIHTLAKERSDLTTSYIQNDILDINKKITMLDHLLPKEIINGWDLILQQMILKFLNTLSSIWKGRDYLSNNTKIITTLNAYFFEKQKTKISGDSLSQDMLIAIFHKLSTRLNQQAVLLNTGLLEKIFYNVSEGYGSMSTYRIRHSLGVLINLCVSNSGRNILEPICSELLQFLILLLNKKEKKVLPYIARLIYVLMANEVFHKKAKDINLHKTLEESIDPSNKRLKLQLDILTSVIDQESPHQFLNGNEENFLANIEAEMDELEEEVEIGEPSLQNNNAAKNSIEESPIKTKSSTVIEPKKSSIPIQRNLKKKSNNLKKINDKKNTDQIKRKPIEKSFIKINNTKPTYNENTLTKSNNRLQSGNPTTIRDKLKLNHNFHEIIESFEENPTSYVILDDNLNPVEKMDQNTNRFIEKTHVQNEIKSEEILQIMDGDQNTNAANKSFVLLSENESNKSSSPEFNLGLSSESNDSAEIVNLTVEEQNEMQEPIIDNSTSKNNYLMVHSTGSPKVSLFIQHGKITAIDYDYCEDTKEIQSPIEHGNIFKVNRQSPYKGLLTEGKKIFKTQPTVISKNKQVINAAEKNKTVVEHTRMPFKSSSETQI